MYTLYHHPYSQHSRRVISLLEQTAIPYQAVMVDMMQNAHLSPGYLAINPNHQVPTLIDDSHTEAEGGPVTIHESNAILRYVCTQQGLNDWYPSQGRPRAMVEQWLDWNQCQLAALVMDIVLNTVFMGDQGDMDAAERALQNIQPRFSVLEQHLALHPYLAGPNPTIADLALASNLFQLSLAKAIPESEHIQRWYDKIASLPGFIASLPKT